MCWLSLSTVEIQIGLLQSVRAGQQLPIDCKNVLINVKFAFMIVHIKIFNWSSENARNIY